MLSVFLILRNCSSALQPCGGWPAELQGILRTRLCDISPAAEIALSHFKVREAVYSLNAQIAALSRVLFDIDQCVSLHTVNLRICRKDEKSHMGGGSNGSHIRTQCPYGTRQVPPGT